MTTLTRPQAAPQQRAAKHGRLGRNALLIAIAAFVIGGALRVTTSLSTLSALTTGVNTHDVGVGVTVFLTGSVTSLVIGTITYVITFALVVWALVQGIIAAVTDRGRTTGIVAAAFAPVVVIAVVVIIPLVTTAIWAAQTT